MEAKTKYQKKIQELVQTKLKPLSKAKEQYFIKRMFWKYATTHYSNLVCLECTHTWKGSFKKRKTHTCPNCKSQVHEPYYRSWGAKDDAHGMTFDRIGDLAVIRYFNIEKFMKKGQKPEYHTQEVMIRVYDPNTGKFTQFGKLLNGMMGSYGGGWLRSSELELRSNGNPIDRRFAITKSCLVYPYKRVPDIFYKKGFTFESNRFNLTPDQLLWGLADNRRETLYKYGEDELFRTFLYDYMHPKMWNALKICFRNHYLIEPEFSISDYVDYVNLLITFKKDTSNPFYACPEDFHAMHQLYVKRKIKLDKKRAREAKERQAERDRQALIKQEEQAVREAKLFADRMDKYKDIVIKKGRITIVPILSAEQMMEESDLLKHCAFASRYHMKEMSVMFSARVGDAIMETIEVSLREDNLYVAQCRGYDNEATKYNEQIVKLMKDHLHIVENIERQINTKMAS